MNYFGLLSCFSELRETIAAIFKHIAVSPNQKTATLENCDEARLGNCDIERKPFHSFALRFASRKKRSSHFKLGSEKISQ